MKKRAHHGASRLVKPKHADWISTRIINNSGGTARVILFFKNHEGGDASDSVAWVDVVLGEDEISQKYHPFVSATMQINAATSPPAESVFVPVTGGTVYDFNSDLEVTVDSTPGGSTITLNNESLGFCSVYVYKDGRLALTELVNASDSYDFSFGPTLWIMATNSDLEGEVDFVSLGNTEVSFIGVKSADIVINNDEEDHLSATLTNVVYA
jgi:hypothetical protein